MIVARPHQLVLNYQGRSASVIAALKRQGWVWGALLDDLRALECKDGSFATVELALADARLSVENLIDTAIAN
ncbi:hypothetical protein SNE35_14230 [Paucibacter sp. R3-3]|uniref:Uncharacterized protein n=1 Tax=Roseateles agri TaxID=3098619 RepID=A0ABU5DHA7_9BURK|nr:hypothetical protein [Paucibacter sp. R3-3]MDY0745673.1 hypothetical protein [Paucibacter sp. R3-3]